jgi:hypothetical protein
VQKQHASVIEADMRTVFVKNDYNEKRPVLQDVETTIWWHNCYLGTTVAFLLTSMIFAGLLFEYYYAWMQRSPCDNDERWIFGSGPDFIDACHEVRTDGLYAIAGKDCPSECDAWWYAKHPSTASARRLTGTKSNVNVMNAKTQTAQLTGTNSNFNAGSTTEMESALLSQNSTDPCPAETINMVTWSCSADPGYEDSCDNAGITNLCYRQYNNESEWADAHSQGCPGIHCNVKYTPFTMFGCSTYSCNPP